MPVIADMEQGSSTGQDEAGVDRIAGLASDELADDQLGLLGFKAQQPRGVGGARQCRLRWLLYLLAAICLVFCVLEVLRRCSPPPLAACGEPKSCKRCDAELGFPPLGRWRCSECGDGYHSVGESVCGANICFCKGGLAMEGSACKTDLIDNCSQCHSGFHPVGATCAMNRCSCRHGTFIGPGPGCSKDGAEECLSCDDGFHIDVGNICAENRCVCRGGTADIGIACDTHGAWKCSMCYDGFYMHGDHCAPIVHVFNSATFMHTKQGAPSLISDLRSCGHNTTSFSAISLEHWNSTSAAVLVLPELFQKLELGSLTGRGLRGWIHSGGHFVVCGDYYGHNGRFLNAVFGWSLQGVLSYSSPTRRPSCSIFCDGPDNVEWDPEVSSYAENSLPALSQAAYGEAHSVAVFTLVYGRGRISYLGFDWYDSNRSNWEKVLNMAVMGSG